MKALLSIVSLFGLTTSLLATTIHPSEVVGMYIYAQDSDSTYLGYITTNKFNPESIINDFGQYGSLTSPTSISNSFSEFGNSFGTFSAYSLFTQTPPIIYSIDPFTNATTPQAYLTKNTLLSPRVDPDELLDYLQNPTPPSSTQISLGVPITYSVSGASVRIKIGSINNFRSFGTQSGALRVSLWATGSPFNGVGSISGIQLGSVVLGKLDGGFSWTGINELTELLDFPPPGEYFLTLTLAEWNGLGFETIDYVNSLSKLSTIDLQLGSLLGYEKLTDESVRLTASSIINPRGGYDYSGTIYLELWAFPQPFQGSFIGGHLLGVASFESLQNLTSYQNVQRDVYFARPPDGTYNIAMVLVEEIAGRQRLADFANFEDKLIFDTPPNQFTISIPVPQNGDVLKDPAQSTLPDGSSVFLTAEPDRGFAFSAWTGDIESTDNPLEVTVTSDLTIEAAFEELPRYTVGVLSGPGYELAMDPDENFYLPGETVFVSVVLAEGYEFAGWPPENGQILEYTFPPIEESTEMNFIPDVQAITYDVTITESEGGLVWSDQGLSDLPGETLVELEARANRGYGFVGWIGSIEATDNPLQIAVTENLIVEAEFVELPRYTLGTLSGLGYELSVEPVESFYLTGETVTITATIAEGFVMDGWSSPDDLGGLVIEYTFPEIEEDQVVTFSPIVSSLDPPTNLWADFEVFGDWRSGWIGWITSVTPQYFYHLNLGTVYYTGESQESVWLYVYADDIGWVWMGKNLYPYVYSWNREWLLHLENSPWFNDLQTEEWFEVTP